MKKVLVVFKSFAPVNNCAAIPNTKLVKYLSKLDLDITVVTGAITSYERIDENLLSPEIRNLNVIRIGNSKLYNATLGNIRKKITNNGVKLKMKSEVRPFRAACVDVIQKVFFGLRDIDWELQAIPQIRRRFSKGEFDIVYTSFPEEDALKIGKYMKKYGYASKWIADFRDPMTYAMYDNGLQSRQSKKQHEYEKLADAITIVSEGARAKFAYDDVPADKITYIPNGFDPDDFRVSTEQSAKTEHLLRLFYAGGLYAGKRDLSVLFRALRELTDEGKIDPAHVRIEYAGNEWSVMQSFAGAYQLEDCCVNYGFITRQRVMELMGEIDGSIVCTHNTAQDQGVVTGKVFELLLVGKPILAVVGGDLPDSELGNIVRDCHAGVVYEQAREQTDYPQLKAWLCHAYQEKMETGTVASQIDTAERDQYAYRNIAEKLYRIMEELA